MEIIRLKALIQDAVSLQHPRKIKLTVLCVLKEMAMLSVALF